jgi:hypothetical protein
VSSLRRVVDELEASPSSAPDDVVRALVEVAEVERERGRETEVAAARSIALPQLRGPCTGHAGPCAGRAGPSARHPIDGRPRKPA